MSYTVTATPEGRWWHVEVPAIGRVTQARNTKEIPIMAADLVEIMTGETNPDLDIHYQVPESVRNHLAAATAARQAEATARTQAAQELRAAAKELRAAHLSLADVGAVLGVSHQRAAQLVA